MPIVEADESVYWKFSGLNSRGRIFQMRHERVLRHERGTGSPMPGVLPRRGETSSAGEVVDQGENTSGACETSAFLFRRAAATANSCVALILVFK